MVARLHGANDVGGELPVENNQLIVRSGQFSDVDRVPPNHVCRDIGWIVARNGGSRLWREGTPPTNAQNRCRSRPRRNHALRHIPRSGSFDPHSKRAHF